MRFKQEREGMMIDLGEETRESSHGSDDGGREGHPASVSKGNPKFLVG